MFHYRLIELEAEIRAREQSNKGLSELSLDCRILLEFLEREVELCLGDLVPKGWKGWLCFKKPDKNALIICRGAAFELGALAKKIRAGFDVPNGADSIREFERGFDVTVPQDLDHLLINFGGDTDRPRVFLWYGENIVPYKLIYAADVDTEPTAELTAAIAEACTWIVKRPKGQTLSQFLAHIGDR